MNTRSNFFPNRRASDERSSPVSSVEICNISHLRDINVVQQRPRNRPECSNWPPPTGCPWEMRNKHQISSCTINTKPHPTNGGFCNIEPSRLPYSQFAKRPTFWQATNRPAGPSSAATLTSSHHIRSSDRGRRIGLSSGIRAPVIHRERRFAQLLTQLIQDQSNRCISRASRAASTP